MGLNHEYRNILQYLYPEQWYLFLEPYFQQWVFQNFYIMLFLCYRIDVYFSHRPLQRF